MLDFLKDVLSSFKQNSLERVKSPFLGAFVFSWLGFNWQLLAVMLISKEDVFIRIKYINEEFGVEKLLIGPVFTTALICITLPLINKFITIIQKQANHDTNELILQAKIDIASKQLEIADFEAKKKLAEEREKKNIAADISGVLANLDDLTLRFEEVSSQSTAKDARIEALLHEEQKAAIKITTLERSLQAVNDEKSLLQKELTNHININDKLKNTSFAQTESLQKISNEVLQTTLTLNESINTNFKLQSDLTALKDANENLQLELKKQRLSHNETLNELSRKNGNYGVSGSFSNAMAEAFKAAKDGLNHTNEASNKITPPAIPDYNEHNKNGP